MTIIFTAVLWLTGIYFADILPWQPWILLLAFIVVAFPAFVFRRDPLVKAPLLYSMIFILGALYHSTTINRFQRSELDAFTDAGPVVMEGWIDEYPVTRDHRTNLNVTLHAINGERINDRVLVTVYGDTDLAYGETIEIYGELTEAPEYDDFSYRDYLARKGIHAIVFHAYVDVIGQHEVGRIKGLLYQARSAAEEQIPLLYPEPYSSLISGILLGVESGISDSVKEEFMVTGTSHTIAISGANMVIISAILMGVLQHLVGEKTAAIVTLPMLFLYAVFTGGDPAVMRASVMMAMALFAPLIHRQAYSPTSLAVAAIVLTLMDSNALWDMGFQLSFLATLGLILFARPLSVMIHRKNKYSENGTRRSGILNGLVEIILVTLSAQVMTLPYLLMKTGEFSIVSLPVNILIAPLQGPIMLFGLSSLIFSFLLFPTGQLFAWITLLFMAVSQGIIRFFASLPFASVKFLPLSMGWLLAIYGVVGAAAFILASSEKTQKLRIEKIRINLPAKAILGVIAILLSLVIMGIFEAPDGRLHVHFADPEQGSDLIVTPSGRSILLFPEGSVREILVMIGEGLPFWDRDIDLIVVAGEGGESIENLRDISRRYRLDTILLIPETSQQEPSHDLFGVADEIAIVRVGTRITIEDGVAISFISPSVMSTTISPLISFNDATLLLMGHLVISDLPEFVFCEASFIEMPELSYLSTYTPERDLCNAQFYLLPEHLRVGEDVSQSGLSFFTREDHLEIETDGTWIRVHH